MSATNPAVIARPIRPDAPLEVCDPELLGASTTVGETELPSGMNNLGGVD